MTVRFPVKIETEVIVIGGYLEQEALCLSQML